MRKIGAIAEKIGEVAVYLGSEQFLMVMRLIIHDTVHNTGHLCSTIDFAGNILNKETKHLVPTWIDKSSVSTNTLSKRREIRSSILAAVKIAENVSALFNLFSGSMTSKEIAYI